MSIIKRHMEDLEAKESAAVQLLTKVGVLETCEIHGTTFQKGDGEVTDAYKLGNANWGEYSGLFKDRREMTDAIKAASENSDYANDQCEACDYRDHRD